MGRLCTPTPRVDPTSSVIGVNGDAYPCATISALDGQIAALADRIRRAGPRFPGLVRDYRADIDLLLERRAWLQLTDQPLAA